MQCAALSVKYEQMSFSFFFILVFFSSFFSFEKVFTIIFSTDVSSVHPQSWYNKLNEKPSLVKIHDCNQRGGCRASASGTYTTEKSTGKWKIYFETRDGLNIVSRTNIFGYHLEAVILCFTVGIYIAQNVQSINWTVNIFKFTSAANLGSF